MDFQLDDDTIRFDDTLEPIPELSHEDLTEELVDGSHAMPFDRIHPSSEREWLWLLKVHSELQKVYDRDIYLLKEISAASVVNGWGKGPTVAARLRRCWRRGWVKRYRLERGEWYKVVVYEFKIEGELPKKTFVHTARRRTDEVYRIAKEVVLEAHREADKMRPFIYFPVRKMAAKMAEKLGKDSIDHKTAVTYLERMEIDGLVGLGLGPNRRGIILILNEEELR